MHNKRFIMAMIFSSLTLCACTASSSKESWHHFERRALADEVVQGQARLVFYRAQNDGMKQTINIAINGEYQASLEAGAYSDAVVCAQPQRVGAFITNQDVRYENKQKKGQLVNLQSGQTLYLQVGLDAQQQPTLQEMSPQAAKAAININRYQSHTLSRVNPQKCGLGK